MKKKAGRKTKIPPIEILKSLYYNNSISAKDLAQTYNVKPQTVYNWIHKIKKNEEKSAPRAETRLTPYGTSCKTIIPHIERRCKDEARSHEAKEGQKSLHSDGQHDKKN